MLDSFDTIEKKLLDCFEKNNLHHAIMISGRSGIGKAEFAKQLAKKILQTENIDNHPDFKHIAKIEGKKNIAVDQIIQIANFFQNSSAQGSAKIVLIEAIEDLNVSSSNAILKILEEPNKNCFLIITCGNFAQILPTIKSRCQIYKVKNLSLTEFKNSFNNLRPSFLPKLSDEELLKLSILTENSTKMAIKNGDELLNILQIILDSIEQKFISQSHINEILKSEFVIFATIYQILISLLIRSDLDSQITKTFPQLNNIARNFSKAQLIIIFNQAIFAFAKTKSVYLDQKLVIINSINRLI